MKIIGETANGFILDATKAEVANLIGFYSGFDISHIKLGAEIAVAKMYHQLYTLSHMRIELESASEALQKYSKAMKSLVPLSITCETKGE